VSAERPAVDAAPRPRRWTWGWLWLTLLCLVAQPLIMFAVASFAWPEVRGLLAAFAGLYTLFSFFLGPVAVATSINAIWLFFTFPSDHVVALCCTTTDEEVIFFGTMVGPLMLPTGMMTSLLLARLVFWRWITLRRGIIAIVIATGVAQSLPWYYEWQVRAVDCSAWRCE
jgi:hypothetical protein